MKRTCADLHLCADTRNLNRFSFLINKASRLGYTLVATPLPLLVAEEQIKEIRRTCEENDIEFATRIDLSPRAPDELLKNLRKHRRKFEIVAVMCESKNVARQAAKDRRVDILNFPQPDFRRAIFDKSEAELASSSLSSLEVDLRLLLTLEAVARTRLIAVMQKQVVTAVEFGVPVVVSSGVSEPLLMRKPLEAAALAFLYGLSEKLGIDGISKNPLALVKRNREKLGRHFVAPGIRVIRRGKDC